MIKDINNNEPEIIEIPKQEYEALKKIREEIRNYELSDFAIKLLKGPVVSSKTSDYEKNRIYIEIFDRDEYTISIYGEKYDINSQYLFNKIKNYIQTNLNTLIDCSIRQNRINLDENAYEGGVSRYIKVKYGNLIININGQVSDIGNLCDDFIETIKKMIIDEKAKNDNDYIIDSIERQ